MPLLVLLLGEPSGLPDRWGFRRKTPHGGRANKAAWCENPVFMRLRRTLPMVTMRLGHGQSQWENAAFPQFSSVFMGEMPIFAGFWAIGPLKPAIGAGLAGFNVGVPHPCRIFIFAARVGNSMNPARSF
jgi:hypothetical protein